ncbi:MAG: hypothetical protein EA391_10695 [Balneolaceae bacterium]|nr:MAG: hypothetical protein EA391_10695 [Balneolaceae bacterium]
MPLLKSCKIAVPAICLLLLLFGSIPVTSAQTKVLIDDDRFGADARNAINALYNRDNDEARDILFIWKEIYPDHPIWLLWDGMELWWKVLEDLVDTSHDKDFINLMREADFEASRLLRREPDHKDALIIRAVSNSYIARLHANREEWLTSVQVGRRGYQAHQRLIEIDPDLPDNLFAEGMKLYYSAYIPETYPFLRPAAMFLPAGSREEGLNTLRKASTDAIFARPEATYFLGNILLNYEEQFDEAKSYFRLLVDEYPDNSYYRRQYMVTLGQLHEFREIVRFYNETMTHRTENKLAEDPLLESELLYWYGRANYFMGNIEPAFKAFEKSVELGNTLTLAKERHFHTLSAYFAGRAAERLQDRATAKSYYQLAAGQNAAPNAKRAAGERLRYL